MQFNNQFRNYIEICYIVIKEKVKTADFLAFFSISQYEYSKDIECIEQIQENYGVKFNFSDENISFDVIDEKTFESESRSLRIFYHMHKFNYDNYSSLQMSMLISKRLLWKGMKSKEEVFLTVDDLADEFGYSRSSLREPLRRAREILSTYDIDVKNVPHHGLSIDGDEFKVRRALIAIYNFLDINVIKDSFDNEFLLKWFKNENYIQIVRCIYETAKKHGITFISIEQRKLVIYLIVQAARIRDGKEIFNPDTLLKKAYNWMGKDEQAIVFANELTDKLYSEFGFGPYSNEEKMSFVWMVFDSGFNEKKVFDYIQEYYKLDYQEVINIIDNYTSVNYGFELKNSCYSVLYQNVISRLVIKDQLDYLHNKFQIFGGKSPLIFANPVVLKIVYDLSNLLSDYFDYRVPSMQLTELGKLVYYYILQLDVAFPKIRIGVASRNSSYEATIMKNDLNSKIDNHLYEEIEIVNYADVLCGGESVPDKYNLILVDQEVDLLNWGMLKTKFLSYGDYNKSTLNLNEEIRKRRDLCSSIVQEDNIHSYDMDYYDKDDIDRLNELLILKCDIKIEEKCIRLTTSKIIKDTAIFILTDYLSKDNALVLGRFTRKVQFNSAKINRYVLFAGKINISNIRLINVLLYELANDEEFFNETSYYCNKKEINERLNKIITQ